MLRCRNRRWGSKFATTTGDRDVNPSKTRYHGTEQVLRNFEIMLGHFVSMIDCTALMFKVHAFNAPEHNSGISILKAHPISRDWYLDKSNKSCARTANAGVIHLTCVTVEAVLSPYCNTCYATTFQLRRNLETTETGLGSRSHAKCRNPGVTVTSNRR